LSDVRMVGKWEEVETEVRRLDSVHFEYSLGRIRSSPNDPERSIHWWAIKNAFLLRLIIASKELNRQVTSRQLPPLTRPIESLFDALKEPFEKTGRHIDWYVLAEHASSIRDLEEKHSCKVVYSEEREGVLHVIASPIKIAENSPVLLVRLRGQIDIGPYKPFLVVDSPDSIKEIKLPAHARRRIGEVAKQIVCLENGGRFDEEGLYYPKTQDSAAILQELYSARL